jgi:hypothetical protein
MGETREAAEVVVARNTNVPQFRVDPHTAAILLQLSRDGRQADGQD